MGAAVSLNGVAIKGIAACVPEREIDNFQFGRELFGDDLEGAIKVTGIERRRTCDEGSVTSLDLCVGAARALSGRSGLEFGELGGIVFVTQTPDTMMPNNASAAQSILGLPAEGPAIDVNMACSGYPYGLWVAGMAAASLGRDVLLLDGDTNSHFSSPYDRATSLLFGDAGTATVVGPAEGEPWYFDFVTDGSLREALLIPEGGYRAKMAPGRAEYRDYPDGGRRRGVDLRMDGMGVFGAVVKYAPKSLKRLLDGSATGAGDYDYLLLHQANLMMISQVAKKLGFAGERFPLSLRDYGNVGSASIALTMCARLAERIESAPSRVLMSAFGAGFSVGSAALSIGPCPCAGVTEYRER